MFTIRFFRSFFDLNQTHETVMSCAEYDKIKISDTEYIINVNGQSLRICDNPETVLEFDLCYVENSSGKTIDRMSSKR